MTALAHASSPAHTEAAFQRLQQRLQQRLPDLAFEVRDSVASTNSELIDRARQGIATPALLMALAQTQGRGRQGRSWLAEAGASLTFSLSLPLQRADWSGLSLAVGVALAEALDATASPQPSPSPDWPDSAQPTPLPQAPRIGLKWPNDLMLISGTGDLPRKLGGILIESIPLAGQRVAVIGIGLNLRPLRPMTAQLDSTAAGDKASSNAASAALSQGFAGLREIHPDIDALQALTLLAEPLLDAIEAFERDGFAPQQARYARRDLLLKQDVSTTLADCPRGRCAGVDTDGALLLQVRGQLRRVVSGEVSVRAESGPGSARDTAHGTAQNTAHNTVHNAAPSEAAC